MSQSIWYKLSGQTKFGAYISIFGATATIVLLVSLIPGFGYMAAAWTTLLVYGGQMVASYLLGQRHYPIRYNLRKAGFYFGWALAVYGACTSPCY
jgi:O-antigen/teichoic acid export membrane protein